MTQTFVLQAELRSGHRRGEVRRLRRLEWMPAIVYGGRKEPLPIRIQHKDMVKALENESFHTQIVTISVDGHQEQTILKDLQRSPAQGTFLHADFLRVSRGQKIIVRTPLHFINADHCYGVRMEGGMLSHAATDLEVRCVQEHLPDHIEVDVVDLKVGETLHISDVQLPEGVESVAIAQGVEHDLPLVSVLSPRGGVQQDLEEMEAEEQAPQSETTEDVGGAAEPQD